MNISIVNINDAPDYLDDVIRLGDVNSDTLGFLSKGAFTKAAQEGLIVIAIADNKICVGYILYRIVKTRRRAAITHLCVHNLYRSMGIARQLVNHLINSTQHLLGISLFCRRDYESNKFWAHIGFQYIGEKTGRGRDQEPLTHYWYDHGHPTLFTLAKEDKLQPKTVMAVIDANVFYDLFNNSKHPLLVDWLADDLTLYVTPEIANEIHRHEIKEQRIKALDYADTFNRTTAQNTQWKSVYEFLRKLYPDELRIQDKSDLKQLSHAIAHNAHFFVTDDGKFKNRLSDVVKRKFSVAMVSPDDLIIYLDEKMNESAYQPSRLAGSLIQIARLQSGQSDFLTDIFHRYTREKKHHLRKQFSTYLENPHQFEMFVVSLGEDAPIAIIALKKDSSPIFEIPLIRFTNNPLSPALESHLIFWCVSRAIKLGKKIVYITEQNISSGLEYAIVSNSFVKSDNNWIKINMNGILRSDDVVGVLQNISLEFPQLNSVAKKICSDLTSALLQSDLAQLIAIEKSLWPLKLSNSNIPTFIVPISPVWAIDLFDAELGKQTLFGSDPGLALRMDNVYYKSARAKVPVENSRILWYVIKGRKPSQGVMSVRACSYVDERVIAPPKELFKQFNKLGVYRWQNVLQTVNNDVNKELLAFRFSRTELFDNPVYLDKLKGIMSIGSAPQSTMSIDNTIFNEIYQLGTLCYQEKDHGK
ncbi:MAG: GNAT family N-acetyltransferase [Caldilineaceae bacterium]